MEVPPPQPIDETEPDPSEFIERDLTDSDLAETDPSSTDHAGAS